MAKTLTKMTDAELSAELLRLGNARDAAYAEAGDAMRAVNQEVNRRAARAKLDPVLAGLTPEARAALLDEMKEG